MKSKAGNHRTWVEIDKKAIAHNVARLRSFLGTSTLFMAVVKSNAYGHGMIEYAKELEALKADFLAVDSLGEALALRKACVKSPILVLGYTMSEEFRTAAEQGVSVTISSLESLKAASEVRSKKKLRIHIKADTGLHRQGFLEIDRARVLAVLEKAKGRVIVEGLYTHFAAMETPGYIEYSRSQIARFDRWRNTFLAAGMNPLTHASASSGLLYGQEFHFDIVRAGIALYGLWPSREIEEAVPYTKLRPVMTWKSVISEIKVVPGGSAIGYDLTERVSRDSKIGIVPVGYWHGYPRSLSSKGFVSVRGRYAKVLGRVSMDMMIVDLTDVSGVRVGDEAVLLGRGGESAEKVAERAGTINYEIVTRINAEIPRIFI